MLQGRSDRREQLLPDRNQVFAHIGIGRKGEPFTATLQIAQPGADRQDVHLAPGVIDVVLALDAVARRLEKIAE